MVCHKHFLLSDFLNIESIYMSLNLLRTDFNGVTVVKDNNDIFPHLYWYMFFCFLQPNQSKRSKMIMFDMLDKYLVELNKYSLLSAALKIKDNFIILS